MIHDARTNPLGLHLPIEQWARHTGIRQLAAQRGIVIPPLRRVAGDATPARALLNHGTWKAFCPDCIGSAEDLWRGRDFFCMRCGNASIGGVWRPVAWPENLAEIEARLDPLPVPTQNWEPWGEARDPVADAEEWLAHARVTMDPEHGLTANEVGGADDPEIWTPPFLATTNAIIASSDCNAGYRGNLLWIRQFLSANPGGAGLPLISTGTDGGGWSQLQTAGLANLAVTTAKVALLAITDALIASVSGTKITDGTIPSGKLGASSVIGSNLADGNITNAKLANNTISGDAKLVPSSVTGNSSSSAIGAGVIHGNRMAANTFDTTQVAAAFATGAIDATNAADIIANGAINGDNKLGASTVTGNAGGSAIGTNVIHANRIVGGSMGESEVDRIVGAGAIDGDRLKSGAAAANLGYTPARIATGTYVGDGIPGTRQITVGFAGKFLILQELSANVCWISNNTTESMLTAQSGPTVGGNANVHLHASDGFVVGDTDNDVGDSAGLTYNYTVIG